MRYSEDLIEEIRTQNDIVSVISGYVRLEKKGSSYFGLCPFHNEKSPSFSVSPGKQMYYCFGCGEGGNVITFLMKYENYSFTEAIKHLSNRVGIVLPEGEFSPEEKKRADKKARLLEMNKAAANYFYKQLQSENGKKAKQYFIERKLTEETMKHFGLGYSNIYNNDLCLYLRKKGYKDADIIEAGLAQHSEKYGLQDKFWNRVMFPIMDVNNHVIGFGGRVMGDAKPKYLNSQETIVFDKSRNLYGLNFARTSREKQILICEGYMDVIAMHQAGFTNAVASLGTAFTSGHAQLLKRYTKEVILVYDSDAAGVKAALRAIPILKEAGIYAKVLNMEPYKDPDEFIKNYGKEKFQERILQAQNSFLFEVNVLQKEYDMNDPEKRNFFYKDVAKKLLTFQEELERESYLEAVAKMCNIDKKMLHSLLVSVSRERTGNIVYQKPKSGIQKKPQKEDSGLHAQRLLLTWLIEKPVLFEKIKPYIGVEDFTEPLYKKVAEILFAQRDQGSINPAGIISLFVEEEQQKTVAKLFHTNLRNVETKEEMEKALSETVYKIKANSIQYAARQLDPTDLSGLQRIVDGKKELQALKGLHIFLD